MQARILTDSTIQHGADIVVFLQRPKDPCNKYCDQKIPEPPKEGEKLETQLVCYSIAWINYAPVRRRETQIKRAIICGRDHTKSSTVDIFEGVSFDRVVQVSQRHSVTYETLFTTTKDAYAYGLFYHRVTEVSVPDGGFASSELVYIFNENLSDSDVDTDANADAKITSDHGSVPPASVEGIDDAEFEAILNDKYSDSDSDADTAGPDVVAGEPEAAKQARSAIGGDGEKDVDVDVNEGTWILACCQCLIM